MNNHPANVLRACCRGLVCLSLCASITAARSDTASTPLVSGSLAGQLIAEPMATWEGWIKPKLMSNLASQLSAEPAALATQQSCCGCSGGGSCTGKNCVCGNAEQQPAADEPIRLELSPQAAASNTFTVVNNGMSSYSITQSGQPTNQNPTLTLERGMTYTFNITAIGHPFDIKTIQSTGTANRYTNGVTGEGTQSGTLTFVVPFDAPDQLFYDCENHIAMTGIINIIPEPVPTALFGIGIGVLARWRLTRKRAPAAAVRGG